MGNSDSSPRHQDRDCEQEIVFFSERNGVPNVRRGERGVKRGESPDQKLRDEGGWRGKGRAELEICRLVQASQTHAAHSMFLARTHVRAESGRLVPPTGKKRI